MSLLKKGDTVQVISGEDKGKTGSVLVVDRENDRVTVQGVNLVYKHLRRSQKHPQGGRIQVEASVHISNVMLVGKDGAPTRARMAAGGDGKRKRTSVKGGAPI
ncbi:MAG: 50S ribosomal protein L24 [Planctomycetota bacterium]|jgi:large subunit ribosomal protein L24